MPDTPIRVTCQAFLILRQRRDKVSPKAGVRSVIDTGGCHDLTPFQAICNTLDARGVVIAA